jgi:hypothetical protein
MGHAAVRWKREPTIEEVHGEPIHQASLADTLRAEYDHTPTVHGGRTILILPGSHGSGEKDTSGTCNQ